MLTYRTAPTVAVGDAITSTQICGLADAWNDRLLAGPGDPAYRFFHWHLNQWRQVRNPDESGYLFPAQAEFLHLYCHLDPSTGITWPVTGPGDPEGANVANPWMQFVFGNIVTPGEADRLNAIFPLGYGGAYDTDLEYYWQLGKMQRGAYDPDTGAQYWPAGEAAQTAFSFAFPPFNPHGKSYGGYFPRPTELLANCGTTAEDGYGIPSYAVKFTGLRTDVTVPTHHGTLSTDAEGRPVITYAGSCPCWTANHAAGHAMGVATYPFAYYVWVAGGGGCSDYSVDAFPIDDWIEGPYTGEGTLEKPDGGHIPRGIWSFALDFRGDPEQRGGHGLLGDLTLPGSGSDAFRIQQIAFPWQEFLTRQYGLAPARGVQISDTELNVLYPVATLTGQQAADSTPTWSSGTTAHPISSPFCLAAVFAKATHLASSVTLLVTVDGTPVGTLGLTPEEPSAILTLDPAPTGAVQVTLGDALAVSDPAGQLLIELAELLAYKPRYWDGYLVARMAATNGPYGSLSAGVDGRGLDEPDSTILGLNLLDYGAVLNKYGVLGAREQAEFVTDNPVFDAARRVTRDHIRMIRRQELVGYEVTASGTHLYFKRFAFGMHNSRADLFHAIAPPIDPVTTLIPGETYIVRSSSGTGSIIHAGQGIPPSVPFLASATSFTPFGDALVYVYDGIRSTALPNGWTNEWVIWLETKCYNESNTSTWKPDAYTDYFPHCNRCLFYGGYVTNGRFIRHIAYNWPVTLDPTTYLPNIPTNPEIQNTLHAPEAPTGYRYASGSNRSGYTADFGSSCQVYVAPYRVTSCIVAEERGGDQVVRVTLDRRLTAHPDAPSTVDYDISTWSSGVKDDLAAEEYRTDDNAIREYLLSLVDATSPCSAKTGDEGIQPAPGYSVFTQTDAPNGSCYPTFFLARLVPKPYDDGNNVANRTDTRCLVDSFLQMEILTRACCEGFMDGQTSLEILCDTEVGSLYDFKFETLCFQAFGGRTLGVLGLEDDPSILGGYGPLPNTIMRADVFNRFSSTVNLLDKAQLHMPLAIETREIIYDGSNTDINPEGVCGGPGWLDGALIATADVEYSDTGWGPSAGINAYYRGSLTGCPWELTSQRKIVQWRVDVDGYDEAIPDAIAELIQEGYAGALVKKTETIGYDRRTIVTVREDTTPCGSAPPDYPFWEIETAGEGFWFDPKDTVTTSCYLASSGVEAPDKPPVSDLYSHDATVPGACYRTAERTTSITFPDLQMAYIQVPLV